MDKSETVERVARAMYVETWELMTAPERYGARLLAERAMIKLREIEQAKSLASASFQ